MATILHVDDEPSVGLLLEDTLTRVGHEPVGAASVAEALKVLARDHVDLVICDDRLGGLTGLEVLSLLQRERHDLPVIVLTGCARIEHAVAAIKAGAIDYVTKPVDRQQLGIAVEQSLQIVRLRRENETLRREVMDFHATRQFGASAPAANGVAAIPPEAVVLTSLNIDEAERALILRALEVTKNNRTRTAELLGISVRTLRNKLNGPRRIQVA
jgi:DNA-binding NtrC family response regulator